jgi:hypothetical protein
LAGSYGRLNSANTWIAAVDVAEWPTAINNVTPRNSGAEVYPNPLVDQRFTVRFTNPEQAHLQFYLIDQLGRKIPLHNQPVKAGENEFSFYTGPLSAGTYIFHITTQQGVLHKQTLLVR